jgi:hypothetical protein
VTELVRYDSMCRAIAEAHKVDEVKDIRDKAIALEHYMRQAGNVEAEERCYEIRRRAERQAWKLLEKMAESGERSRGGGDTADKSSAKETLFDLGVTKKQSHEWQKLAKVDDKAFDASFAKGGKPSIAEITGWGKEISAISDEALLFIGTIRYVERIYLEKTPAHFLATMTETMLEEVYRVAPRAAAWLATIKK